MTFPTTPPLVLDPIAATERAARLVRQALTDLGHVYTRQDGRKVPIVYKSLSVAGDDEYALLEVDTQRLPPRVNARDLTDPKVLHHLTTVVGHPVRRLNTTGLTYCVVLRLTPQVRLPPRADLDLAHRPTDKPYQVPIGAGREGPVWRSLLDTGHILVGGESGSGKSSWLHSALAALLTAHGPAELQLYLVDPKMVEFTVWAGVPHLVRPIAEESDAATQVTARVLAELDRWAALFQAVLARDLLTYNRRATAPLPLVLVVIDEVTDLALQAGLSSAFYTYLIRLAAKARSFGVVLVVWRGAGAGDPASQGRGPEHADPRKLLHPHRLPGDHPRPQQGHLGRGWGAGDSAHGAGSPGGPAGRRLDDLAGLLPV